MTVQRCSNISPRRSVKENFTQLCVRIGKAKNHGLKTEFTSEVTPIQQKGRRVPTHHQERVEAKLNKLIDQKLIVKLDKCSARKQPDRNNVEKVQTVKLALDSEKTSNSSTKTKFKCQIYCYFLTTSLKQKNLTQKNKPCSRILT